ncbi:hypothetical protein ACROYT_G015670 [Oculina patagonica]
MFESDLLASWRDDGSESINTDDNDVEEASSSKGKKKGRRSTNAKQKESCGGSKQQKSARPSTDSSKASKPKAKAKKGVAMCDASQKECSALLQEYNFACKDVNILQWKEEIIQDAKDPVIAVTTINIQKEVQENSILVSTATERTTSGLGSFFNNCTVQNVHITLGSNFSHTC